MIIQHAENFFDKNFSDRVSNFLAKSSFLEYLDHTEYMFVNQNVGNFIVLLRKTGTFRKVLHRTIRRNVE